MQAARTGHGAGSCCRLPCAVRRSRANPGASLQPTPVPGNRQMRTTKGGSGRDITSRLAAAATDADARNRLVADLHGELLRIARAELLRHQRGNTLNTRALVNEAYLRLFAGAPDFASRKHFFATAAKAMRQVVIDYARKRAAERRGAGAVHVGLADVEQLADAASALPIDEQADQLLALDRALSQLSTLDERLAHIMELRLFAGMSVEDVAAALELSVPTVVRDSRTAKAYLQSVLHAPS